MSSQESSAKSWYLVYSKPRQEDVALTHLARQGYSAYLPRCRRLRKRQGRSLPVIEPLFPRYLFIHLDTHVDNWGPIRSTQGVTSLVRFGQKPAPVPDSLIVFLRSREGEDGLSLWLEPQHQTGDRVRVADGPLEGYEGILLAKTGRERVVVLLEILGKQVRTQLAVDRLERSS
jgi:transcriptional antiterminator RfaH